MQNIIIVTVMIDVFGSFTKYGNETKANSILPAV